MKTIFERTQVDATNRDGGAFDIQLEVGLQTLRMRNEGRPAERICRTTYRHAYWTLAQLIAHHTVKEGLHNLGASA